MTKTIISDAGTFGPFQSVQVLSDRLRADGVDFQFDAIGTYTVSSAAQDPAPPQMAIPGRVSMLAARTILYKEGLLQLVESFIAAMAGEAGDLARIKWATALTVRRDDDLVTQVIPQLGKTEAEIDAMFLAGDLIDRNS